MKNNLVLSFVFILLSAFYSCTKDTAASGTTVCNSSKISFTTTVQPIFVARCATAGCHDATTKQNNYNLATYLDAKSAVENGNAICYMQGTCIPQMPEGGLPLDTMTIDSIIRWKNDGYCN